MSVDTRSVRVTLLRTELRSTGFRHIRESWCADADAVMNALAVERDALVQQAAALQTHVTVLQADNKRLRAALAEAGQ